VNIQLFGWLDTSLLWANFRLRYHDQLRDDGPLLKLHLRDDDRGDLPILTGERKFGSAVSFLQRFRNEAAKLTRQPADLGAVWIESLLPGSHTPWLQSDDTDMLTVHIALASNPQALFYCGGEGGQLGVGYCNVINTQALHSAINLGTSPRVHLVLRVRRPEAEAA
jgi:Aspartyl/Asparaginyl beta-hydroxylase